jgi:hypothetical protein
MTLSPSCGFQYTAACNFRGGQQEETLVDLFGVFNGSKLLSKVETWMLVSLKPEWVSWRCIQIWSSSGGADTQVTLSILKVCCEISRCTRFELQGSVYATQVLILRSVFPSCNCCDFSHFLQLLFGCCKFLEYYLGFWRCPGYHPRRKITYMGRLAPG